MQTGGEQASARFHLQDSAERSGAKDSEQRDRVDAVASGGLGRVYRKGCSRTGCRTSWPFRPLTPLSHCCLTYTSPLDRSPMYTLPTRSTSSRPTRPYPAPVPRVHRRPFGPISIPWSTQTQTPAGNGVHLLIISISNRPHTLRPPLATASIC